MPYLLPVPAMTRVAWTLKYMGVPNVAILNGGYTQLVKEKKPISQDALKAELAALTTKVAGSDLKKEIILYCDTGKTCTGWAFIMTEMIGYKNVKVYDGSFMEWAVDANAPLEQ